MILIAKKIMKNLPDACCRQQRPRARALCYANLSNSPYNRETTSLEYASLQSHLLEPKQRPGRKKIEFFR